MAKLTTNSTTYSVDTTGKKIAGGNGIDTIDSNTDTRFATGNWTISGGNGDDIIRAGSGNDTIWGDSLGNSGGISDNGADKMYGGAGNDEIHGGNGADLLQGDAGADVLFGDKGGDTFRYTSVGDSAAAGGAWSATTGDWIKDFTSSQGDKIDLSAVPLTGAAPGTMLTWSATGGAAYDVWASGGFVYADTNGDGTADIAIKVTGTVGPNDFIGVNHDPNALNDTNAVNEDSSVSGTVATGDTDSDGDTLTYTLVAPVAGLSLAANGGYTFNAGNTAYQHLAAGATEVVTANILVSDGKGGTATQTLKITVTGTNDAPVITSTTQSGSVQEDVTGTATGQVTSSDVDDGATKTFSGNATGTYGSFAVNSATGEWTYTLDSAGHQDLAQGETQTETFTVTVTDDQNATATQTVTITITGTNDAPVITSADQTGDVSEDDVESVSGQVTASDVDNGAVLSFSGDDSGVYGDFAVDSVTGEWTYTLNSAAHQDLAEGESHDEVFTVTVTDEFGGTTTQDVTVTVTGTNDAPEITSAAQTGDVSEDDVESVSGQVTASDVDNGAVLSFSGDDSGVYGDFAVDSVTGEWTYTLNSAAHQDLAEGESHDEVFTVTVTDEFGGTTTQDVTVTVTGTNDAPEITSAAQTGDVSEDDVESVSGQVTASDVDNGAVLEFSGDASGTYGEFAVDSVTGEWTYTLNSAAHQDLAEGESHDEVFTVTVTDEFGGTTTQDVTVTVTGTNDAPVAVAATNTVTEDSSVSGSVTSTDVDNGATATYSLDAPVAGLTLNADGSYTFDASNSAYQHLAAGATQVVTANFTVTDEHNATSTSTLKITVTGTNDAPVITGTATGSVTEDSGSYTIGSDLNAADVDDGQNDVWSTTSTAVGTAHGTFSISASGVWSYTLNNSDAEVAALNNGGTLTDTFSITTADGTAASVVVTINGHSDGVTLAAVVTSGDPDNNDSLGNPVGNTVPGSSNAANLLYGGAGDDQVNSGNGNDTVYGGSGNDTINGGGDNDTLYGGDGNDIINGGNNNDTIYGGYGADTVTGAQLSDTFAYKSVNDRGDTINDFAVGTDKIDLSAIDAVAGGADNPFVWGGTTPTANGVWYALDTTVTHVYVDTDGDTSTAELWFDVSNGGAAVTLSGSDFVL